MNEAIFIFNIVLASQDGGRTNPVERFQCECDSYIEAIEKCIDYCKQNDFHAVLIEEDYAAEFEY